ncbi:MAG: phage holin [Monoglobales bacterium]
MNINWKIRVKNVSFWISIAIAVFTPILAYMGITAQDITTWAALGNVLLDAVSNPYILLMVAVSVYNAIVDPTSTGVSDSANALTYTEPNSEKGT